MTIATFLGVELWVVQLFRGLKGVVLHQNRQLPDCSRVPSESIGLTEKGETYGYGRASKGR